MAGLHARCEALVEEWNGWITAKANRADLLPYDEARAALDGFWARWEGLREEAGRIDTPAAGRAARDLYMQSASASCRGVEYLRDYYQSHDVEHLVQGNAALNEADLFYQRFTDAMDDLSAACPGG